jgi:hypothetical protein
MSKIVRAHFNFYRNEAHYEYMVVFRGKVIIFPTVFTLIQTLFPEFEDFLDKEGKLVDAQKKSSYTALIVEADNLNDRLALGMKDNVTVAMRHYDQNIATAAKRLNDRIDAFGKIARKSYEEEAAAISILVTDLQSPMFANDVVIVNIGGWITQLAASLDNFKNLLQLRNESIAPNLPKENLKIIRKLIDAAYNKMIARINAAAELDDTGMYEQFIQKINAEIHYFNEHTHRSAKKDLAEGDRTIIESVGDQRCSGKAITPIPVVIYREEGKPDVTLTFTVDFSLSYKNNVKPGMAEITVRGKGAYRGQKSTTFTITEES